MKTKLFVVIAGNWESDGIVGIYSTKELADSAKEKFDNTLPNKKGKFWWAEWSKIENYILDK